MAVLLLELGADVNGYRTTGCTGSMAMTNTCLKSTVLMVVSYYGYLDWVTMLLATPGINVNHFNKVGKTALDLSLETSVGQQIRQPLRDAGGKCGPVQNSNCMDAYAEYQPGTYPWSWKYTVSNLLLITPKIT